MFTAYRRISKALYTISVYTICYPQFTKFNFFLFHSSPITGSSRNSTALLISFLPNYRQFTKFNYPPYSSIPDYTQFTKFNFSSFSFLPDYRQFTKFDFPTITRPLLTARSSRNSTSLLLSIPDYMQFTKFNFPTITRPLLTAHSSQNSTSSFFVPPRLHAVHKIQLLPFSFLPNYTQFTKFNCLFVLPGIWLIVSSQYQDKCTRGRWLYSHKVIKFQFIALTKSVILSVLQCAANLLIPIIAGGNDTLI